MITTVLGVQQGWDRADKEPRPKTRSYLKREINIGAAFISAGLMTCQNIRARMLMMTCLFKNLRFLKILLLFYKKSSVKFDSMVSHFFSCYEVNSDILE